MSLEKVIAEELTLSYVQAGRHISGDNVTIVANALANSIDFRTEYDVREAFKIARNTADIPTQKVLTEAMFAIRMRDTSTTNSIEYADRRKAWLPQSDLMRKVNFDTAVKRLCIAQGDSEYKRYIDATCTKKNGEKVEYVNPVAAKAFLEEKSAIIKELYLKYIRTLPSYRDFPQDAKLNFGLLPPEVAQFRQMLDSEAQDYAWGDYN